MSTPASTALPGLDHSLVDVAEAAARDPAGHAVLQALALRTTSPDVLRVLDALAPGRGPAWQVAAAVVRAVLVPEDRLAATRRLVDVVRQHGPDAVPARDQLVLAQLLYGSGRLDELDEVLPLLTGLAEDDAHHLRTDVLARRSTVDGSRGHGEAWWRRFTSTWRDRGLLEPSLQPGPDDPLFDGLDVGDEQLSRAREELRASLQHEGSGGDDVPLISVVVSSFRPDAGLRTAVRSLLRQTWPRVEVVVVDDASGDGFDALYAEVTAHPGVRLVRQPDNGGTYVARERGLREVTGQFVTFHDSDDWAHPQRLERQVLPLLADDPPPATHSLSMRTLDDLDRQWLGYPAVRTNASSLMVPRDVLDRVGPFDPVRKSADSEFTARLERLTGRSCATVEEVLSVVRLRASSLSRGDFSMGWARASRIGYQEAYRAWHGSLDAGSATVDLVTTTALGRRPFPAPGSWLPTDAALVSLGAAPAALGPPGPADRQEVLVVADLTRRQLPDGTPTAQVLLELADAGLRVLVLHRESTARLARARPRTDRDVCAALASQRAVQVYPDEPRSVARGLVLDPGCLVLRRPAPERLRCGVLTVVEPSGGAPVSTIRRVRRHAGAWADTTRTVRQDGGRPWTDLLGGTR